MKIGVFSDSHYSSKEISCGVRYNSKSLEKIINAYQYFNQEKCELIICLGDLIDTEPTTKKVLENLDKIADVINSVDIKTVCLRGNHDAFALTKDEFYNTLRLDEPKDIETNGTYLLFLDACYFKNGKSYSKGDDDWTDTFYPFEALLEERLKKLKGNVYIFIHQSIDPTVDGECRLFNADKLFDIINKSGKVKTVFQGHYHVGCVSNYNGVEYVTLPAMCQNDKAFYVYEL